MALSFILTKLKTALALFLTGGRSSAALLSRFFLVPQEELCSFFLPLPFVFFATLTAPLGLTYSDPLTDLGVNCQLPSALLAGTATGTLKQTSVLKLRVTQSFCSQMCVAKSGDSKCRDTGRQQM